MEPDPYSSQLIFFFILLGLSAFFSGSETAFFSINNFLSQKLKDENSAAARRTLSLLLHPRRLLVTILIGNTLVNVTAASVAAILVMRYAQDIGLSRNLAIFINVGVVTFLILILSEITPKIIAVKNPSTFAKNVSIILWGLYYLLLPISFVLDRLMEWMTSSFGLEEDEKERLLEVEEFQTLLDIGEEQGDLEQAAPVLDI